MNQKKSKTKSDSPVRYSFKNTNTPPPPPPLNLWLALAGILTLLLVGCQCGTGTEPSTAVSATNISISNFITSNTTHYYRVTHTTTTNRFLALVYYSNSTTQSTNIFLSNTYGSSSFSQVLELSNSLLVSTNASYLTNITHSSSNSYQVTNYTNTYAQVTQYVTNVTNESFVLATNIGTNTNWEGLAFPSANFANLNLSRYNLLGVDFSNANLSNANLTNAKLVGANIDNGNFTNANLTNAQVDFAGYNYLTDNQSYRSNGYVSDDFQQALVDDGATNDEFGGSVFIDGDYAIVGARGDDDNGSSSGSAYIFTRSGTSWTQQAKITPDDGASSDSFGSSVSISGDYAIVGAYRDGDNGFLSGSAYIFVRSGISWTQQAKIKPSDGASLDLFGRSVSIDANYAIVGAYNDDDNGSGSGSAYIFVRSDTSWTQQAKIKPSDGATDDNFGLFVSISGNYAIVGAYGDDDNGNDSGSAYIFVRSDTSWTQQAKIKPSDGATDDEFGYSVSISGAYAVVGALRDDDNGNNSGSAYIFTRSDTSWTQQAKIKPSDGATDDEFGYSVSISGAYAVVGALRDDDNGNNSGSAYIFTRSDTSWTQQVKIKSSGGAAGDNFGFSVSISGAHAIVGANLDDDNGSSSGSAYLVKYR